LTARSPDSISVAAATDITESDQEGVCVLGASGGLDLDAAVQFCARVDAARLSHCRPLLLDLSDLRACDGSGLRALFRAAEEVLASGGRVAAVPPADGDAARMFAGASEIVPLHGSVGEGVAALAAH
jgi:anti-anti-sigma factor